MMTTIITIIASVLLGISVLLFWYISILLKKYFNLEQSIIDFMADIEAFKEHLEYINSLDTFYGDETLQEFLNHTTELNDNIEKFKEFFLKSGNKFG